MDEREARAVLGEQLRRYRVCSYTDLQGLLEQPEAFEVQGPSGTQYQVEVEAVWDDQAGGNLRVLAAIDDGGLRALVPLTEDFILAPDGTFVGE